MTPISAPVAVNSSLVARGRMPPWPNASPAMRYSGIGEIANRAETAPSSPRPRMTAPISIRTAAPCICSAVGEDAGDGGGTVGRPDHDDQVARGEHEVGPGAGEDLPGPDHGHDRRAGTRAGLGGAEVAPVVRGAGRDRHLDRLEPGHLPLQVGQALDDARGAEQLG